MNYVINYPKHKLLLFVALS